MRAKVAVAVLATATALTTAGCGGSSKVPYRVVSADGDVRVTSCRLSTSGVPVAALRITNHSSYRADYTISVDFTVGATTSRAFPNLTGGVAPGASASTDATGISPVPPGTHPSCRVASAKRNPTERIPTTT